MITIFPQADLSVFRPSEGNWYLNRSTQGFTAVGFGLSADIPTPGDFDGDFKADIAVWRPPDGNWYRLNSTNGQFTVIHFGQTAIFLNPAISMRMAKTTLPFSGLRVGFGMF